LLLDLTPLDTPSGPRGIGRYIRELAIGLSELPKEELAGIDIVGLTSLSWTGGHRVTRDIAAFRGGARSAAPTESDFYQWAYRQRLALWLAAQRVGADAVHICDPHATPLFLGLARCKRIVTCHDLVPTKFPERYFGARDGGAFLGKRIERRRYESADLVVAISDATRADAISLLGVAPDRIVRVYNGIDVSWWAERRDTSIEATLARFGLVGRSFVLYVGGSDWRKNTEGMMGGLARARKLGVDLVLAWAGHLQPGHVAHVEEQARRFGVSHAALRLGYVSDEDLALLYRAARAPARLALRGIRSHGCRGNGVRLPRHHDPCRLACGSGRRRRALGRPRRPSCHCRRARARLSRSRSTRRPHSPRSRTSAALFARCASARHGANVS